MLQLFSILLDIIRTIRDPEKPATLEDLSVVFEDGITVNIIILCATMPNAAHLETPNI